MKELRILKHKEIDKQKWNALIYSSVNSLPYALTYYLDAVAENWDAVVLDDYKAVLPLVWLRKLGFKCLYQPYYCQQLGVFSKENLSTITMKEMVAQTRQFAYVDINLNPSTEIIADEFSFKMKKNLLLDLNKAYSTIRKKYSENHRRNIAKAERNKLQFFEEVEIKQFQQFYLGNVNRAKENFKPQHEKIFKALTKVLFTNNTAKVFAVRTEGGTPLAAVMLLNHQNRIINIINTSSAEGKKNGASHLLFDKIIQKFSNTQKVLDFEGSSIPTIARFYEGFGAQEEIFYKYHTTIAKKLSQRFL